jgi:hypothetical protein
MPISPIYFRKIDEVESPTREGEGWTAEGHRNFTRRFLVLLKNEYKSLGAGYVCQAPGLPMPYAPYVTDDGNDSDLYAVATRFRSFAPDATAPVLRYVDVEYSTNVPEGGVSVGELFGTDLIGAQNNPELKPWHIEWDPESFMRTPARDLDGFTFLNSATQPFATPYQQETGRATLLIVRNMLAFDRKTITKYSFATNTDVFLGCEPGTVLCMPPRGVMMNFGGLRYMRTRWVLKFGAIREPEFGEFIPGEDVPEDYDKMESWEYIDILDQGLCRLQNWPGAGDFGKPVPIYRQNHQIAQPDLLDGHGQPVGAGLPRNPVYLRFRVRRKLPFGSMFNQGLTDTGFF